MFLIFDTETTGFPRNKKAPLTDFDNWPRMVQIAWQLNDYNGELIDAQNHIVIPEGYDIPYGAEKIHGISTQLALDKGVELSFVLNEFNKIIEKADYLIGHNIAFDIPIVGCEYLRKKINSTVVTEKTLDTQLSSTRYCQLPGGRGGSFKWPKLNELHTKLFNEDFDEAHNATADVVATTRSFFELVRLGVIKPEEYGKNTTFLNQFRSINPGPIEPANVEVEEQVNVKPVESKNEIKAKKEVHNISKATFSHLHLHTQYSVLQSTVNVPDLINKAIEHNMPAVAMTDHGNMFGAFNFVSKALQNDLLPIVGCEYYITEDRTIKKFTKDLPDRRYNIPLLAKNKKGYHNLTKLCSYGFTEGHYAGYPRIDKPLLEKYKEHLVCLTGGMTGEIPWLILNVGESKAEEAFQWYHKTFKDDFYIVLQRHGLEEENRVNETLLRFAKKYEVKYIAGNNTYYLDKKDANAHDILLCVKDGEQQSTPIGRGRGFRFGFPNEEFYFKSQEEMKQIFSDLPEAIDNTEELVEKFESYELKRDILLPEFKFPAEFETEDDYLRHLTYEGAKTRYPAINDEVRDRLDFELKVIKDMGFPGYFLIVQDFTSEARKMGVSVGPGRGSAAGSAVAYSIRITNIDPIKYKLLFERFLNPERVSMPDIDIDFDDEGRAKVIDFVLKKYGYSQVAQIITYGSMAAKSSIRDVSRVKELPLFESDRLAKLVPDFASLKKIFHQSEKDLKAKFKAEQVDNVLQLQKIFRDDNDASKILHQAEIVEGSIRNTGTHACGIIITPDDMTNYIPVSIAKDSDLLVTQFDNKVIEDAGMLKMDFLGLKTLTIIKDTINLVKIKHGVEIDPDEIPLDDVKTFELYQRGETNGTFQFESGGMQKSLRILKPTNIEDLIAMNALYRPGPMQFIETYVKRKHGEEEVEYPHELLEDILKDTFGIMVYQEQIMQTAQILGGYTLGGADLLRRAMGKKKKDVMAEQKVVFRDGCKVHHDIEGDHADKIFGVMEKFAEYGFNRSHSAAYSVVAFQTGYLKAHYPAEYMAAVLTNNMSDIKKVSFYMDECKRAGLAVLGPDVNESSLKFSVNAEGAIRFGLGAIKGVGESAVEAIINQREENGFFNSIFDLTKRIDLRSANKRTLEALALSGGFDSFENSHRSMYFYDENGNTFLEKAIKFGAKFQESVNSAQVSLFGESSEVSMPEPPLPICEKWGTLQKLKQEKEVVGIFISGHPLDDFKLELDNFCNSNIGVLENFDAVKGRELSFAGIVTDSTERITKTGKPFGKITIEDYSNAFEFVLFGEDYINFRKYFKPDLYLFVNGRVQLKPWKGATDLEFKFIKIELLNDVRNKQSKKVYLKVNIEDVNDQLIKTIEDLVSAEEGSCKVFLTILDRKEKIKTELYVKNKGVRVSNEFIESLNNIPQINFSLN